VRGKWVGFYPGKNSRVRETLMVQWKIAILQALKASIPYPSIIDFIGLLE